MPARCRAPSLMVAGLVCLVCLAGPGDAADTSATAPRDRTYMILPMPMEMPDRNDRSEQCWLRIEDIEIVDTITMYCYVAQEFLGAYIPKYNLKKQKEDGFNYAIEDDDDFRQPAAAAPLDDEAVDRTNLNVVNSWKSHSVIDSITGRRIYVSRKAICRLLMYSREGMSSYQVDCPEIIEYIHRSNDSGAPSMVPCLLLSVATLARQVLMG